MYYELFRDDIMRNKSTKLCRIELVSKIEQLSLKEIEELITDYGINKALTLVMKSESLCKLGRCSNEDNQDRNYTRSILYILIYDEIIIKYGDE
jgi:hypothetical protein